MHSMILDMINKFLSSHLPAEASEPATSKEPKALPAVQTPPLQTDPWGSPATHDDIRWSEPASGPNQRALPNTESGVTKPTKKLPFKGLRDAFQKRFYARGMKGSSHGDRQGRPMYANPWQSGPAESWAGQPQARQNPNPRPGYQTIRQDPQPWPTQPQVRQNSQPWPSQPYGFPPVQRSMIHRPPHAGPMQMYPGMNPVHGPHRGSMNRPYRPAPPRQHPWY